MSEHILAHWQHKTESDESFLILPDGCRDVVLVHTEQAGVQWFFSALQDAPLSVTLAAGAEVEGFRLAAGSRLDEQCLNAELAQAQSRAELHAVIATASRREAAIADALASLAAGEPIPTDPAAQRRWQRLFRLHAGRPPVFWRNLARARQAARQLQRGLPSIEVAGECGYSDQAHLSREMQRWFGMSPTQAAGSTTLAETLAASAYA